MSGDAEDPVRTSDLSTRFVAGVVMVAVALAAVYYGGWYFRILVAAAAAIMMIEWSDMHRVPRIWAWTGAALIALYLLGVTEWLFAADEMDSEISLASFGPAWTGIALAALPALLIGLASRRLTMLGGFLYLALPAFVLLVLDWLWFELVLWALVVTWATDIFAYFAGRSIGGPKLAPRISPNKTWAGLLGGVVGAGVVGFVVAQAFALEPIFAFSGALMGLIAQAGDLYESWLKRRAGVKDSGTILPGHGGVLDRLDGLLPVIIATMGLLLVIL
jgi:phosphatidate cytidylyltransferase